MNRRRAAAGVVAVSAAAALLAWGGGGSKRPVDYNAARRQVIGEILNGKLSLQQESPSAPSSAPPASPSAVAAAPSLPERLAALVPGGEGFTTDEGTPTTCADSLDFVDVSGAHAPRGCSVVTRISQPSNYDLAVVVVRIPDSSERRYQQSVEATYERQYGNLGRDSTIPGLTDSVEVLAHASTGDELGIFFSVGPYLVLEQRSSAYQPAITRQTIHADEALALAIRGVLANASSR